MRVIHGASVEEKENPIEQMLSGLSDVLPFDLPWGSEKRAQELVVERLRRGLDNRFILLQNIVLEGMEVPILMILIGPNGIITLNTYGQRGIFRAKEGDWAEMNRTTRQFQPGRVNLIKQTQLLAKAVDTYLTRKNHSHPEVQSVLVFSHPGVHVDSVRPAVRMVLVDGLDRFITGLNQQRSSEGLKPIETKGIVDALMKTGAYGEKFDTLDALEQEERDKVIAPETKPVPQLNLPPFLANNFRFSKRQWILLGVIVAANVCMLIGFILLILFTA